MLLACALLAAASAWLLAGPVRTLTRLREAPDRRRQRSAGTRRAVALVLATGGATAAAAGLLGPPAAVLTAAVGLVALTGARVLGATVDRRRSETSRRAVAEACQVLAQLVAVGQTPAEGLGLAAEDCPVLAEAAAVQRLGGDPASAWRRAASRPGHQGLRTLARAWQVGQATGASMVRPLQDAADALHADEQLARTLRAELSAPRATGRMLAVLPLFGLALGRLIGGHPGTFLLRQPAGQACLLVGTVLVCAGVLWVERLAVARDGP